MTSKKLAELINKALEELKAMDIVTLDVRRLTSITDYMVIASGRSDRQVRALADKVIEAAKKNHVSPLGVEGKQQGEWILVDLGDVIVHVMHPSARLYYQLEKLWTPEHQQTSSS